MFRKQNKRPVEKGTVSNIAVLFKKGGNMMNFSGFADEAGKDIDTQIRATVRAANLTGQMHLG